MTKEKKIDIELEELDMNDLGSVLRTYHGLNRVYEAIEEKLKMLKNKLKEEMKKRKWTSYNDDKSKVSVSLSTKQKESVNKKTLKMLLNDEQYNQVVTKKSVEHLLIVTPKDRERLKKYGKE